MQISPRTGHVMFYQKGQNNIYCYGGYVANPKTPAQFEKHQENMIDNYGAVNTLMEMDLNAKAIKKGWQLSDFSVVVDQDQFGLEHKYSKLTRVPII